MIRSANKKPGAKTWARWQILRGPYTDLPDRLKDRHVLDPVTKRLLPWVVAIAFFMQTLDGTILNTTLPAMAKDLGESPLRMQSVVIAYMLTVALFIPASGWLADRFGTRRAFLSAIVLFSLGSLLCALSPSLPWLVAARVVQGIGGALLLPVGRLTILRAFPRSELLKVLSFVTIPGLVGPLVGPPLGGWLVEVASWHWVFLINLPVGVLGVFASLRYMPDLRGAADQRFDWPGFVMFSLGLVLVTLGLQGLGEHAISAPLSILLVIGGLAAMAAYWVHAARADKPLFSLTLFQIPTFSVGILGNLFARLGSGAMPFLTPLFLQVGPRLFAEPRRADDGADRARRDADQVLRRAGDQALRLPPRAGHQHAAAGRLHRRLLARRRQPHALIRCSACQLWVHRDGLFGVVNSMQFTAMNTITLGDLDDVRASGGNSLLSVVMQLSMSLGVASARARVARGARAVRAVGAPRPRSWVASPAHLSCAAHRLHRRDGPYRGLGRVLGAVGARGRHLLPARAREGPSGPATVVDQSWDRMAGATQSAAWHLNPKAAAHPCCTTSTPNSSPR